MELGTRIAPGFEALVFKSSRCIEDIYELTYVPRTAAAGRPSCRSLHCGDAPGSIIGYLMIGTDNSGHRKIEAEQKQLAERLSDQQFYTRTLFESNIDALMTTDLAGTITDVNNQMETLTGSTRDCLIGTPLKDALPIRSGPKQCSSRYSTIAGSPTRNSPHAAVTKRKRWYPFARPRSVTLTEPDGHIVDARNITERRQAENRSSIWPFMTR